MPVPSPSLLLPRLSGAPRGPRPLFPWQRMPEKPGEVRCLRDGKREHADGWGCGLRNAPPTQKLSTEPAVLFPRRSLLICVGLGLSLPEWDGRGLFEAGGECVGEQVLLGRWGANLGLGETATNRPGHWLMETAINHNLPPMYMWKGSRGPKGKEENYNPAGQRVASPTQWTCCCC